MPICWLSSRALSRAPYSALYRSLYRVLHRHRAARRIALIGIAVLSVVAPVSRITAQSSDIIRGRVTGPDSLPIANVQVRATSFSGSVTKIARTDRRGRFTLLFVNGEGDYWLDFAALGYAAKRFEIKRIGEEEVLLADTRLQSLITTLDQVTVTANGQRRLPNRNGTSDDVGGGDRTLTNNTSVPPDRAGNLAAMAAGVPGVQLLPGMDGQPDMYSALGLSGDQNNTSYNGLGSSLNTLPPDAQVRMSFNQFPWDVARGGFSGAQISVQTLPGTNFSSRNQSGFGTAPPLQWTDDSADSTGQKSTTLRYGGSARGPIAMNRAFYNGAYGYQRRFTDALTLLNASDAGLAAAGVAPDSVTRLLDILRRQRVPVTTTQAPALNATDQISVQSNIDLTPSASGTGHAFTLSSNGFYTHSRPTLGGPGVGSLLTTVPGRTNNNETWLLSSALTHSNYFGFGILSRSSLGASYQNTRSRPLLAFPSGSVRVNSSLDDGSASIRNLSFGGGPFPVAQSALTVALSNQLLWYSVDNKHTIKLTSNLTREQQVNDAASNLLGTFQFNSLADLEAGRPALYTRTLNNVIGAVGQLTGGVSLGDAWRPTREVQVQFGLRVDGNAFLYRPETNALLRRELGIDNNVVPNRVAFSPRIGVQWTYGKSPQVAFAPGAARPPLAVIHAGVGVFQNVGPATLLSGPVANTGTASSTQGLTCVGAAAPTPLWERYLGDPTTVPATCADGGDTNVFAQRQPTVFAFDRDFRQQRSIRGALDWSSPTLDNRFVFGAQLVYSWNMHQVGQSDRNLDATTRFTLDQEASRPVFAPANAIVPLTGNVALASTRRSAAFQRVLLLDAEQRSVSRNVVLKLLPVTANKYLRWQLQYSLLDVREQFNGFTSTVANPFTREWGPTLLPGRHQLQLGWSAIPLFDLLFIDLQVGVRTGSRFTPLVAGDVNGDGAPLNDRAFIFDPARKSDPTVAAAMQALLTTGAPAARRCLAQQIGTLAARGSCQAPWIANTNLSIGFNAQKLGLPKRLGINLAFTNPLGIADLLINGSRNAKGWGQEIAPDQQLLFVRGFDPATNRFRYEVNQRFGTTRPQQTVARTPAYASLSFNLDVGAPRERQLLTQRLDIGRRREGNKATAEAVKSLGSQSIPNPMYMILTQQDTLKLTRMQADSLAQLSRRYTQFGDSVWTPVAQQLEAFPTHYDRDAAYARYTEARERTIDFLMTLVPDVKRLLTGTQKRRLPPQISNYLDARVLRFLRSSSAGDLSPFVIR